jgi:hypothetical protein
VPLDEPPPAFLYRRLVEVAEATAEGQQILVGERLAGGWCWYQRRDRDDGKAGR